MVALKLIHFSKKSGRLSLTGSKILAFGSQCSANCQLILDCFTPKFKLKHAYDDLQNIKTDRVNTVLSTYIKSNSRSFSGTLGTLTILYKNLMGITVSNE